MLESVSLRQRKLGIGASNDAQECKGEQSVKGDNQQQHHKLAWRGLRTRICERCDRSPPRLWPGWTIAAALDLLLLAVC